VPEDEQMVTRSKFKGFASVAASGLLVMLSGTAANASALEAAAWLGHIEVTAPVVHRVADQSTAIADLGSMVVTATRTAVANLGAMTVSASPTTAIANLGAMTVTAVSERAFANRAAPAASAGEAASQRTRPSRAVLVQ
jgi:hypothetical protein